MKELSKNKYNYFIKLKNIITFFNFPKINLKLHLKTNGKKQILKVNLINIL